MTDLEQFLKRAKALADALQYLQARWKWTDSQIARVLHLAPTTVNNWIRKKAVPINSEALSPDIQAVVHLLAIHRSLEAMFEDPLHQTEWLKTPHPDLIVPPLEKISESIEGLISVRQHLDYVRGRGAMTVEEL